MASMMNSIKHLRKDKKILNKLQKYCKEENTFHSFYEPNITLIPNQTKILQERNLQTSISHEYSCKDSKQNFRKFNPTIY